MALDATSSVRKTVFVDLHTLPYIDMNAFSYNHLFKSPEFWNNTIPEEEENILVYHTDSMPCSSEMLDLDRYGTFGYIGCMCGRDQVGPGGAPFFGPYPFYGIGGVSLRRRTFMLDCLNVYPDKQCPDGEDVTFSSCNDVLSYKYGRPPGMYDVGDFCGQCGWGNATRDPQSWASHKVSMGNPKNLERFLEYCPDAITAEMAGLDSSASVKA